MPCGLVKPSVVNRPTTLEPPDPPPVRVVVVLPPLLLEEPLPVGNVLRPPVVLPGAFTPPINRIYYGIAVRSEIKVLLVITELLEPRDQIATVGDLHAVLQNMTICYHNNNNQPVALPTVLLTNQGLLHLQGMRIAVAGSARIHPRCESADERMQINIMRMKRVVQDYVYQSKELWDEKRIKTH